MAAKKAGQAVDGRPGRDGQVDAAELELARQRAERAWAEGLSLTGPGGLLGRLTKVVLEGPWKARWTPTWGIPGTIRRAATTGTRATGTGPRLCSPTWGRWRSARPGTQHRSQPVQQRPGRLVRADLQRPLQILRRDPVPGGGEQPAGMEPHSQRRPRPVEAPSLPSPRSADCSGRTRSSRQPPV
jgi:hypothetical protein